MLCRQEAERFECARIKGTPQLLAVEAGACVEVVGIYLDDSAQARGTRIGQRLGMDARAVLAA